MALILVEQAVTTTDTPAGHRSWVEDGEAARGMIAGGFWIVRQEQVSEPARKVRTPARGVRVEEKVVADVVDPVGPGSGESGSGPVG